MSAGAKDFTPSTARTTSAAPPPAASKVFRRVAGQAAATAQKPATGGAMQPWPFDPKLLPGRTVTGRLVAFQNASGPWYLLGSNEGENSFRWEMQRGSPVSKESTGQFIQTAAGAKKILKALFLKPNGAENFFN